MVYGTVHVDAPRRERRTDRVNALLGHGSLAAAFWD